MAEGAGVTYTITVTNTSSGPEPLWLGSARSAAARAFRSRERVTAKVRAERLRDGFWELTFLALRKGAPNLKRTATFQAC